MNNDNRSTPEELAAKGYKLKAYSMNDKVNSYIAVIKGRKVYGYYDYKQNCYIEESSR